MSESIKDWVIREAATHGFDKAGVTRASAHDFASDLDGFLAQNFHGEMGWLEERKAWRSAPKRLWPETRSIIMLAMRYDPPVPNAQPDCATISAYALGRDYHDVVKKRLKAMGRALIEAHGGEIKVFVDTAPVMEKPLAQAAGIGWQGKHGNLLSRDLGNWFFLAAIFTTLEIEEDEKASDHCGSCRACIDACPTNAFTADGHLDARRCISYLTIELKTIIPEEFRAAMGTLIYGCDICLAACPWNKFEANGAAALAPVPERVHPPLATLLAFDDEAFRAFFRASPIKRIGWGKFISNCLIAAGNACAETDRPELRAAIARHSQSENPLIAEAAAWAKARHS